MPRHSQLDAGAMHCATCSHNNPDAAKFCAECGAALARRCGSCDTENPPGARFCNGCGSALGSIAAAPAVASPVPARDARTYTPKHLADKILQSRSALEDERKQMTVLFADVKGSMELAEQLEPEEWHRILERFFAILTEGVHRFEGTVNQYTGDGIMALFGAPHIPSRQRILPLPPENRGFPSYPLPPTGLAWVGTDQSRTECFDTDWCSESVVGSVTFNSW